MSEIRITVSEEAAAYYESADEQDRARIAAVVEERTKKMRASKKLMSLMNDISREVRANGATEEEIQEFIDSLS